jgi:FMN-dependent NADH-azoreductase
VGPFSLLKMTVGVAAGALTRPAERSSEVSRPENLGRSGGMNFLRPDCSRFNPCLVRLRPVFILPSLRQTVQFSQDLLNLLHALGNAVGHGGRDGGLVLAVHNALLLQPAQPLRQDAGRNALNLPPQRPKAGRTDIAASDALIAELAGADTIVIGAPMYNFSIPFPLKAWIDQIVRRSHTFSYGPDGPKGLLKDKKVFVITSRAGAYGPESPMKGADFQEPYLRFILGFIGIKDVTFIQAESQGREEGSASLAAAAQQIEHSARQSSLV